MNWCWISARIKFSLLWVICIYFFIRFQTWIQVISCSSHVCFSPLQVFIIIGFIALFIFGIIGITRVVDGLDLTDIVPRETQEYKFLEAQDKYFGFYNMYAVTKREFDYASPEGQKLLLDYHQGFQHVQQIIKKEDGTLPRFWLQLFRDWLLGEYNGKVDIDGLVQERRNSSALAMELRLSCTNPSISRFTVQDWCKSIANTLDIYIYGIIYWSYSSFVLNHWYDWFTDRKISHIADWGLASHRWIHAKETEFQCISNGVLSFFN